MIKIWILKVINVLGVTGCSRFYWFNRCKKTSKEPTLSLFERQSRLIDWTICHNLRVRPSETSGCHNCVQIIEIRHQRFPPINSTILSGFKIQNVDVISEAD